jgi:hypothetical protein
LLQLNQRRIVLCFLISFAWRLQLLLLLGVFDLAYDLQQAT